MLWWLSFRRAGAIVILLGAMQACAVCAQDCWDYTSADPAPILGHVSVYCSRHVAVSGHYAFVPDENHVNVVDVSVPSSPSIVAQVSAARASDPETIVLNSGRAYVCHGWAGICIYDISNPIAPVFLGARALDWIPYDVSVAGERAYVVTNQVLGSEASFYVVDIHDSTAPVIVGRRSLAGYSPWCCTEPTPEGYVYVGTNGNRVLVMDVNNPAAPQLVADVGTTGPVRDMQRQGDLLYLASGTATTVPPPAPDLVVLDITSRLAPVPFGSLQLPGLGERLEIVGLHAYVACGAYGVQVVDISSPAVPVRIGALDTPGQALGVAIGGSWLVVADFTSGAQIARPDCDGVVSVPDAVPTGVLRSVYPNPFNPCTTIECDLPQPMPLKVTIHDQRGRLLRILVDGPMPAGAQRMEWNGRDSRDRPLPSGTYLVRVITDRGTQVGKVTLAK